MRLLMGGSTTQVRHVDAVGSTTMVANQSGGTSGDIVYDPWGNAMTGGGSNGDSFAGLGFQVNYPLPPSLTRDYNDGLGRWLTPDPAGAMAVNPANPQTWNMYAYVGDNPTTLNDPSGLKSAGGGADCSQFGGTDNGQMIHGVFTMRSASGLNCAGDGDGFVYLYSFHAPSLGGFDTSYQYAFREQVKTSASVFSCASDFANKYSIAGGLHALGIGTSGVGGFITNALGGNVFSGATNLIESFGGGSAGGHNVFYNMGQGMTAGPLQGIPGGRGPWGASVSDLATGAIAGGYYNAVTGAGETLTTLSGEVGLSSATMTAAEFASGVGIAKFVYDSLSYGAGLLGCKAGVIP